jgi:hypothetical protein
MLALNLLVICRAERMFRLLYISNGIFHVVM